MIDARLFWEEESGKKGDRFNVNNMVGTGHEAQHELLLRRAQVLYTKLFGKSEQNQERVKPTYVSVKMQVHELVACSV